MGGIISLIVYHAVISARVEPTLPEVEISPREEVINEIKRQAAVYNINEKTALRIAKCESGYNRYARNPHSTAKGVYQFINGTWRGYCSGDVFDHKANIKCFMEQYPKHKNWWVCK